MNGTHPEPAANGDENQAGSSKNPQTYKLSLRGKGKGGVEEWTGMRSKVVQI